MTPNFLSSWLEVYKATHIPSRSVSYPGSCQTCRVTVGVAVSAVTLVTGLSLCLILFCLLSAAPEVDRPLNTSDKELPEQLLQCRKKLSDLSLMLHAVTRDSRCGVCPDGWMWWRGHCYFFSFGLQEDRQWNESAEFCQGHNSSLAVIKDSAEMDFIQDVMRKFPRFPFLWVGLTDTQQEGRWMWRDGTDIQHYMLMKVEWDADHRDCADLRGGGTLFAADCEEHGPWACKRES
ncbi:natural killer cells antigen CD94-like [Stegastes partitus]|uniref:Natural killer cells antigen CD94-like n=1 Tax=Stegastes partitus TaxID=144197 RepID=A0A9Y4MTP9_9TELE|nr:PREDICTED: natural killer cells antigen CD94-like [Stegastes partitus]